VVQFYPDPVPLPTLPAKGVFPVVVVTPFVPFVNPSLAIAINAWNQPPDPQPTVPRPVFWPGRSVDNPPGLVRQFDAVQFQSADPQIQISRFLPQGLVVTSKPPSLPTWFYSVYSSWTTTDPLPTLPRPIAGLLYIPSTVNNPPFGLPPIWLLGGLQAWAAPDPLPQQSVPSATAPNYVPPVVNNPPFGMIRPGDPGVWASQFDPNPYYGVVNIRYNVVIQPGVTPLAVYILGGGGLVEVIDETGLGGSSVGGRFTSKRTV
jgi:hypothetical protein